MLDDEKKEAIRQLSQMRSEFEEFFRVLSSRQRNRSFSDIDILVNSIKDGPEYERRKLAIEFFRKLEKIGVGEFKIGRRGKSTRFIWHVPMLDVMRPTTPNETTGTENERKQEDNQHNNVINSTSEIASKPEVLTHKYILRPNFVVSIDLPANLTEVEADRLSAFIKTLPIKQ